MMTLQEFYDWTLEEYHASPDPTMERMLDAMRTALKPKFPKELKMTRPIVFFDLESTGKVPATDQIIEISCLKLNMDGTKKIHTTRVKPTIPIDPGATEVHGITIEDLADCKTFEQIAPSLFKFISGCDLGGFNSNKFDVPMLYFEFLRTGFVLDYRSVNLLDAGNIMKIEESRTLVAAAKFYNNVDLEDAHSAEADIMATFDVFMAQLNRYDIPADVESLALYSNYDKPILDLSGKFTFNETGEVLYNFGAHMGKPVFENIDYLSWMLSKDFAPDTVAICNQLMDEYQQQLKNKQ